MFLVAIQRAQDTGLFHPAYYRLAPFPGGVVTPARYKSVGHHTEGFATLADAQIHASELVAAVAAKVGTCDGAVPFDVIDVESAGAHVLLSTRAASAPTAGGTPCIAHRITTS